MEHQWPEARHHTVMDKPLSFPSCAQSQAAEAGGVGQAGASTVLCVHSSKRVWTFFFFACLLAAPLFPHTLHYGKASHKILNVFFLASLGA